MPYNYFANSFFTVSQTTDLHSENTGMDIDYFDYILDINIGPTLNSFFNTRQFKQTNNQQNDPLENNVTIDFVINRTFIESILTSNTVSIPAGTGDLSKLIYEPTQAGLRFLEIVATKIFGSAKARAAISNDTEFYNLSNQIMNGIQNSINNKKHDIFNQYVQYDKIEDNVNNDVDDFVNFNFYESEITIPLYFLSSLDANSNFSGLRNGPGTAIIGGSESSRLINGSMNIPLLMRFLNN